MADRKRPGDKITIHHPDIKQQVRRTRKQLEVLEKVGWREGRLPTPSPAGKATSSASTTSGDGGK